MKLTTINCVITARLCIGLCVTVALSSCQNSPVPQMIIGEYVFQYPSGHVEALRLDEDLKYQQELYPNLVCFQLSDSVLFTNEGTWSLTEGELTFHKMLWFSGGGGPSTPDLYPRQGSTANIGWIAPTKSDPALLVFIGDRPYYFIRIPNRVDIPASLAEQANWWR